MNVVLDRLISFIVLGMIATNAVVEIIHHGKIFKGLRERAEWWQASDNGFKRWLGSLIGCPFCLSTWAGLVVSGLLIYSYSYASVWPLLLMSAFVFGRLANILNAFLGNTDLDDTPRNERDRWVAQSVPVTDDADEDEAEDDPEPEDDEDTDKVEEGMEESLRLHPDR